MSAFTANVVQSSGNIFKLPPFHPMLPRSTSTHRPFQPVHSTPVQLISFCDQLVNSPTSSPPASAVASQRCFSTIFRLYHAVHQSDNTPRHKQTHLHLQAASTGQLTMNSAIPHRIHHSPQLFKISGHTQFSGLSFNVNQLLGLSS